MLFSKEELRRLIVPLMIEQILAVTIGMADTMMVANVGEAAVSGVSLVDSINILLINIFSAMATGGAVVASQYIGRQDRQSACSAAKQLIYSSAFIALLLGLLALVGGEHLLRLVFGSVDADVMAYAETYFWLSALSYPFLAVYNAGAALFRSMSNSSISMKTSILMNIINIGGNALLIYGFDMGVAGAGTATLVSRATGAVVMMWLLRNRHNLIYVEHLFHYRLDWQMVKRILRVGVPNGLENGMFQVGKVLVSSLIAMFGTTAITANAIANNLASFECIPGNALGLAMITVIGRCVGAGDYEQAKYYAKKLMKLTYIFMAGIGVLLMALCVPITWLYNPSQETFDLAIWLGIYHSVCAMAIWPAAFALPNILRASGDVRFTMLTSVISMWLCRILFSYVLALGFHLELKGVWIAMTLDWLVRAIFFVWRYFSGRWQNKQVLS